MTWCWQNSNICPFSMLLKEDHRNIMCAGSASETWCCVCILTITILFLQRGISAIWIFISEFLGRLYRQSFKFVVTFLSNLFMILGPSACFTLWIIMSKYFPSFIPTLRFLTGCVKACCMHLFWCVHLILQKKWDFHFFLNYLF